LQWVWAVPLLLLSPPLRCAFCTIPE
jgi:hypothetical protein